MAQKDGPPRPKTICVDFDGVIHSYTSGWQSADKCPDPPVDGAIVWLERLLSDPMLRVCIYSSRSKEPAGVEAMKKWFSVHGLSPEKLDFPTQKPAAFLTIDDRAWCFRGVFPSTDEIHSFQTWQDKKRE